MQDFTCNFSQASKPFAHFLGAYRRERPCAARLARRLASATDPVPQRSGVSARALSCAAIRRDGNAYLRGERTPLLVLQRRSNNGFPPLYRYEALRGAELHARNPRFRRHHRVSVPSQRDAAKGLQPVGHTHRETGGALGGTLRREGSARVVL